MDILHFGEASRCCDIWTMIRLRSCCVRLNVLFVLSFLLFILSLSLQLKNRRSFTLRLVHYAVSWYHGKLSKHILLSSFSSNKSNNHLCPHADISLLIDLGKLWILSFIVYLGLSVFWFVRVVAVTMSLLFVMYSTRRKCIWTRDGSVYIIFLLLLHFCKLCM